MFRLFRSLSLLIIWVGLALNLEPHTPAHPMNYRLDLLQNAKVYLAVKIAVVYRLQTFFFFLQYIWQDRDGEGERAGPGQGMGESRA